MQARARRARARDLRAARQPEPRRARTASTIYPGDQTLVGRREPRCSCARRSASSASRRSPACSSAARTRAARSTTSGPRCTTPTACCCIRRDRRVDSGGRSTIRDTLEVQLVPHAQPARLRPDAARPRLRALPGPRDAHGDAPERLDRAPGRLGRRAASSWCEIPTQADIHDNIVAYWVPAQPADPAKPLDFAYTHDVVRRRPDAAARRSRDRDAPRPRHASRTATAS